MSLFNNLRRAFGLGDDNEEDEVFLDDVNTQDVTGTAAKVTDEPDCQACPSAEDSQTSESDEIAAEMMAAVVELFNSFQPDFIARCLDPDRQKKLIAESLAPALRSRLASIAAAERETVTRQAQAERQALDEDLRKMRDRNAELEKRRDAFRNEQLSSTRQKRALQERIHDLETQNEQLAAEKEQLELENRSMANKIRVAGVSAAAQPDPETEKLAAEAKELRAETGRLKEETAKQYAAIEEKDKELTELREQLRLSQEIAEQADRFADTIARKDARIAELKARVKEAEASAVTISRLEGENKSLRSTIESNLYEHAAEMSGLRAQLEELRNKAPRRGRPRKNRDTNQEEEAAPKRKHSENVKPRISAIDELIEGSDWLVAPTPEEMTQQSVEEPADDFGYRAPSRKPVPHDDSSQLTLF